MSGLCQRPASLHLLNAHWPSARKVYHLKRRPATRLHELLQTGTGLDMPRCPRVPQIVPAKVLNASTGQGVLPCLGGCTRHRCVFVGKDKDRMLAGLLSMLLHCADATRLQGYAGGRAPTVGALGDARAVAEGLDWTWRHELAGERVNDQNPLRSARRVRQDFGMIRLESSGSDCSMGMSFRGKGVNPSYTHTRVLY